MVEYEKENDVSFEDITQQKDNFIKTIKYEKLINNLPHGALEILFYTALIIAVCVFIFLSFLSPDSFWKADYLSTNLAIAASIVPMTWVVLGAISLLIQSIFNVDLLYYSNKYQINQINQKYLSENKAIPDIEKHKDDYYTFLAEKKNRLCLINEIDNTLLSANHYQIKTAAIPELESLKHQYLSFNLSKSKNDMLSFRNLNEYIIEKIQTIKSSINKVKDNSFYTEYIKVDSMKPAPTLKRVEVTSKYKDIL